MKSRIFENKHFVSLLSEKPKGRGRALRAKIKPEIGIANQQFLLHGNPNGLANIMVPQPKDKAKISAREGMKVGTEKASAMRTIGKPVGHGGIGEL